MANTAPIKPRTRERGGWLGIAALALLAQAMPGCIYDSDNRCGDGMELDSAQGLCVCAAGYAYTPTGCVKCGEHEVTSANGCVCEDGFSRPTADAACVETPSGLGLACDPAASTCAAPYDHCEPSSGADAGYCTSSCATSDDCTGGYACNADSVCQRPPVGLNKSCTSPDDCAGTEATFCDTFQTHACQVQGCQLDPNNCFVGYECCDLSAFGLPEPLCVPQGLCMQ